jgi:hypothetical protein
MISKRNLKPWFFIMALYSNRIKFCSAGEISEGINLLRFFLPITICRELSSDWIDVACRWLQLIMLNNQLLKELYNIFLVTKLRMLMFEVEFILNTINSNVLNIVLLFITILSSFIFDDSRRKSCSGYLNGVGGPNRLW